MAQKPSQTEQDREATMNTDETLSEESRKKRDCGGNIGAFGKRTGNSDLIFFEGILPVSGGDILRNHSIEEQISTAVGNCVSIR